MFGALYGAEGNTSEALADVAREFSPRIDICGPRAFDGAQAREIVLDLSGLTRLFGDARTIAEELRRTAADRKLQVRVAIAGTRTAARLLVRHRAGLTIVDSGTEAAALAPLPLALLGEIADLRDSGSGIRDSKKSPSPASRVPSPASRVPSPASRVPSPASRVPSPDDLGVVFRQWGLRTLGDLAALPADDLAARLGQPGVHWQRLARGDDPAPLVPAVPEERFEQSMDLEWPIEELEPLAFVLGRLMEPLEAHLERRGRGAAVLHVRLHLIKTDGVASDVHERSLQLPTPIRDARTLRTLALLDLESNPPAAPIDRVVVAVDPTPERIVQFSLLTRPLPSPEQLSTLMARLHALMGESRCGSPAVVDSWKPGAFEMTPFAPKDSNVVHGHGPRRREDAENGVSLRSKSLRVSASPRLVAVNEVSNPVLALRRFRHPVPARVRVEDGKPVRVTIDRRGMHGGGVETCAGPWRTSGEWWGTGTRDSGLGTREPGAPSDPGSRIPSLDVARDALSDSRRADPEPWDHDEWDVTLTDGATYRLFRARDTDRWFVDGVID